MILRRFLGMVVLAGLAVAFAGAAASAASTGLAAFVLVHGLPGRNVGAAIDPLLPIDVEITGGALGKLCLLKNVYFSQIAGPFDVAPGSYGIVISTANLVTPCSNAALISTTANLAAGALTSVVATLSSKGKPAAEIFAASLATVPAGEQRVVAANAADMQSGATLKVFVTSNSSPPSGPEFSLAPGKQEAVEVSALYSFDVSAEIPPSPTPSVGPFTFNPGPRSVILVYFVGSEANSSLGLLSRVIPDVF